MINYEAIMKMTVAQLEAFLDEVYCTGLNTGLYAARFDNEEFYEILDENPFSFKWLLDEAEPAVLETDLSDNKEMLDALKKALLRNAGIDYDECDEV